MKKCSKCGNECKDTVKFCRGCGHAFEEQGAKSTEAADAQVEQEAAPPTSASTAPTESEAKTDTKSKTTLIVAIAAVVAVIVIAVAAVVISNNMQAATEQREATSIEVPAEVVEETPPVEPEPIEEPVVEPEPVPEPTEDEMLERQEFEASFDAAIWGEAPADDWLPQSGAYYVFIAASQDFSAMGQRLRDAKNSVPNIPAAGVLISSEWSNLNSDRWYCAAFGPFHDGHYADIALGVIRGAGFGDAYVKWSGPRR